jgi:ribosomal protein S18 acetylase RimI-like enzyme
MENTQFVFLTPEHFPDILKLSEQVHGLNYLDQAKLEELYEKSFQKNRNASWVAIDRDRLIGYRLTIAPGNWQADQWCSPDLWNMPIEQLCYFKTIAISQEYRGQGIGSHLLKLSISSVRQQGGRGGLAHIWVASPNNSAYHYFAKAGGKRIATHQGKWSDPQGNYQCPACNTDCQCEAAEMLLRFGYS